MPETRLERIVAVLASAAIVGLVAIIVPMWLRYRDSDASARSSLRAPAQTVNAASQPVSPTATDAAPAPAPTFGLTARGGSCWIEVHSQSSQGKLLYQGLLANGKTVSVTGRQLWIRAGAGNFLEITLGGKTLGGVPRGTADIVVTATGVRPANA